MPKLIVYSSRTGNTKKVAEAIAEALAPCDIFPVESAPSCAGYDLTGIGFWVDKGEPDKACQNYMRQVKNAKVGLFGTLGAYPDSDHARQCVEKAEAIMREGGNQVAGTFMCMGRVDPKILEMMQKVAASQHPMTPERSARIKEAEKHPDAEDCRRAAEMFQGFARQGQ